MNCLCSSAGRCFSKAQGKRYQTLMDAVLKSYVEHQSQKARRGSR
jgi:hypothetical protein